MAAWYNEIDPYAAAWLRELIKAGHIAPGEVDERSIIDVRPDDLRGFTQCHFFAGIGGWSYAARLAGWPDDRELWTGSCPCQPFSAAGKRKGFDDARHLWPSFADLIRERDPPVVFGEQVASATDWLRLVRSDLEAMGRAVGAIPIEAASAGADHLRDRFWFVTDRDLVDLASIGRGEGRPEHELRSGRATPASASRAIDLADAGPQRGPAGLSGSITGQEGHAGEPDDDRSENHMGDARSETSRRDARAVSSAQAECSRTRCQYGGGAHRVEPSSAALDWAVGADGKARRVKSGVRLLAHGVPDRVVKLRAFGNAIDPRPAAQFIGAYLDTERLRLMSRMEDNMGVFA